MKANEVLIDLLEDNRRRLIRLFKAAPDTCIYWQPDEKSNNIAITVWHMGRMFDVFLVQQTKGQSPEEGCWFKYGWAERTGYDPRGIGENGWGMLTGYTLEEAAAVPMLPKDELLEYLSQVYDEVVGYLKVTSIKTLLTPCPGFGGRYSKYQCLQMALMDNVRHMGEINSLKNRWERRSN